MTYGQEGEPWFKISARSPRSVINTTCSSAFIYYIPVRSLLSCGLAMFLRAIMTRLNRKSTSGSACPHCFLIFFIKCAQRHTHTSTFISRKTWNIRLLWVINETTIDKKIKCVNIWVKCILLQMEWCKWKHDFEIDFIWIAHTTSLYYITIVWFLGVFSPKFPPKTEIFEKPVSRLWDLSSLLLLCLCISPKRLFFFSPLTFPSFTSLLLSFLPQYTAAHMTSCTLDADEQTSLPSQPIPHFLHLPSSSFCLPSIQFSCFFLPYFMFTYHVFFLIKHFLNKCLEMFYIEAPGTLSGILGTIDCKVCLHVIGWWIFWGMKVCLLVLCLLMNKFQGWQFLRESGLRWCHCMLSKLLHMWRIGSGLQKPSHPLRFEIYCISL